MDISLLSSIAGLITFLASLIFWLYKLIRALVKQVAQARIDAIEIQNVVDELVSSATNAEKRADIYVYLTMRAIHIESRQTRETIQQITLITALFAALGISISSGQLFNFELLQPTTIFIHLLLWGALIGGVVFLWICWKLRKLESGWKSGVLAAMHTKLDKHAMKD